MSNYINSLIERDIREDGRKLEEYRKITVEENISPKSAEGSARVRIGDTEVIAGVKMDIGEPFPDSEDEGVLVVNAELIPLASPDFESGPPGIDSIELARVVDRGIRESHVLDMENLCVKKGEKVWILNVDIYPINDAGNLFDAAFLAAMAALKNTRIPNLKNDKVEYGTKGKELPLKKTVTECTVFNIKDKFILDPTKDEEKAAEARLTVASFKDTICAMQKGGEKLLSMDEIGRMIDIAMKNNDGLRGYLK